MSGGFSFWNMSDHLILFRSKTKITVRTMYAIEPTSGWVGSTATGPKLAEGYFLVTGDFVSGCAARDLRCLE